jgi:hypothetical protein
MSSLSGACGLGAPLNFCTSTAVCISCISQGHQVCMHLLLSQCWVEFPSISDPTLPSDKTQQTVLEETGLASRL